MLKLAKTGGKYKKTVFSLDKIGNNPYNQNGFNVILESIANKEALELST